MTEQEELETIDAECWAAVPEGLRELDAADAAIAYAVREILHLRHELADAERANEHCNAELQIAIKQVIAIDADNRVLRMPAAELERGFAALRDVRAAAEARVRELETLYLDAHLAICRAFGRALHDRNTLEHAGLTDRACIEHIPVELRETSQRKRIAVLEAEVAELQQAMLDHERLTQPRIAENERLRVALESIGESYGEDQGRDWVVRQLREAMEGKE